MCLLPLPGAAGERAVEYLPGLVGQPPGEGAFTEEEIFWPFLRPGCQQDRAPRLSTTRLAY